METSPVYLASVAAPLSLHALCGRVVALAVSKAKKQPHV
jgi:hypothetical protein